MTSHTLRFPNAVTRTPVAVLGVFLAATGCGGATASGAPEPSGDPRGCTVLPCNDPVAAAAHAEGQLAQISTPGFQEWEARVRAIVVEEYDLDASGAVDTTEEVDRILCSVWQAIDAGYRERSAQGDSVRTGYGIAPYGFYIDGLGVARNQREFLRQKLLDCGIQ